MAPCFAILVHLPMASCQALYVTCPCLLLFPPPYLTHALDCTYLMCPRSLPRSSLLFLATVAICEWACIGFAISHRFHDLRNPAIMIPVAIYVFAGINNTGVATHCDLSLILLVANILIISHVWFVYLRCPASC